ncbi:MAG: 3-dehydro-L-gulonate 2-dehydrogenase [Tissierella sp.]|nr:3-dehydro-L-gulonate 2-dehydrogenase [Tissierella sp.]
MRIQYDDMLNEFKRILIKKGFSEQDAYLSSKLFTENSLNGVYTHGVNRFPRVIKYIDKGYIKVDKKAEKVDGFGSFERWDGNLGMGNINAKISMDRAIELAREFGIGIVALRNTNHWMRGGTYGWQAADAGCIGICWTNTLPNMPAWGAKDSKVGNNPFIMSVPRSNGQHVVVDMAMSQFSYGKIEEYRLNGKTLPVPGGYDSEGNLSTNPEAIEETGRVLPVGFWKGSSLSIVLDLIAAVLSGGRTTYDIGKETEDEYGISQVFIAIDQSKFNLPELTDEIINNTVNDIKESTPKNADTNILYPGERVIATRKENLEKGIPVEESIWNRIIKF